MQHNDISEDKEIDVAKVGQVSTDGSQCGSVYSDDGTAPTLTAGTHGDAKTHTKRVLETDGFLR